MINSLSVILPVLNSAATLPACLACLLPYKEQLQIIAVDGGSLDGSEIILRQHPEILRLHSRPGRAHQMNTGAAHATSKDLLFLHSDTVLEGDWFYAAAKMLEDRNTAMGTFKFALNKTGLPYTLISAGTRLRGYFFHRPYGDQAYFMRQSMFKKLGGFKEQNLMEDVDLLHRASQHGRIGCLKLRAFTSASAWECDGPWRRTFQNWKTYHAYQLGKKSPEELAEAYYQQPTALGVFCKQPISGKVKTRLGKSIGFEQASTIYDKLVKHSTQVIKKLPGRISTYYFIDPPGEREAIQQWLGLEHKLVPQSRGDLGDRMLSAFEFCHEHGHHATLLIGTDCPELTPAILKQAQQALKKVDIVLGPASDGGYYLIGAKKPHPELFDAMQWSTETVLSETLKRIKAMGLTHDLLPQLHDLDTEEDLRFHQKTFDFLTGGTNSRLS